MSNQLSINEDEMQAIVAACRAIRLFSKHQTTGALYEYFMTEEICNRAENKLYWQGGMLNLFKQIEDKFNTRLKEHGII